MNFMIADIDPAAITILIRSHIFLEVELIQGLVSEVKLNIKLHIKIHIKKPFFKEF